MEFLTNEKLTIVGAAGMIGSNMAQTAMMMKLTPNICLYDPFAPALEGVAEELYHCGFEGVNLTYTSDIKEALTGASYIVSSGGAARKAGMTREDLLKGNAEIAAQFGKDVRQYCPNVKHIVVIFNPADITGLITLLYSGLKPSQVSTLAALDSTRLQNELVKYFHIPASEIQNCRTYGGHGEQMAVFASTTKVKGEPLTDFIGTTRLPLTEWEELKAGKKPELTGSLFVGIKYGHDGNNVAMAVAARTTEGKIFVEAIDCREVRAGTGWILKYLTVWNARKVVVDGANGQQLLEDDMKEYGLKSPVLPTVKEIIAANTAFEQGLFQDNIRHMGQPSLTNAVGNCEKRAIGANGGFGYKAQKEGIEIALLDSVILAYWACSTTKEVKKKQRVRY